MLPPTSAPLIKVVPPMSQLSTDQLLNKLDWLKSRSVTDFKGHAPQPEKKLKMGDVIKAKEANERKLVGGLFVPFTHNKNAAKTNIPYHATRVGVIRKHEDDKENLQRFTSQPDPCHPTNNSYKQRLDPSTGRPEVSTVLNYNEEWIPQPKREGKRHCGPRHQTSIFGSTSGPNARPLNDHVADLEAGARCSLLRDDLMRHPMFTKESKIAHATTHWDPMSQLLAHQFVEPPLKDRPKAKAKRNPVRMAGLSRSVPPAHRAWH